MLHAPLLSSTSRILPPLQALPAALIDGRAWARAACGREAVGEVGALEEIAAGAERGEQWSEHSQSRADPAAVATRNPAHPERSPLQVGLTCRRSPSWQPAGAA